jgi:hypothetical protein
MQCIYRHATVRDVTQAAVTRTFNRVPFQLLDECFVGGQFVYRGLIEEQLKFTSNESHDIFIC